MNQQQLASICDDSLYSTDDMNSYWNTFLNIQLNSEEPILVVSFPCINVTYNSGIDLKKFRVTE